MATVIRMARHGTKKKPYYRIVVADKTAPRDGRFIENIGTYVPQRGIDSMTLKRDRLEYWLGCGAQMSQTVENRVKLAQRNLAKITPPEPKSAPKKEA